MINSLQNMNAQNQVLNLDCDDRIVSLQKYTTPSTSASKFGSSS